MQNLKNFLISLSMILSVIAIVSCADNSNSTNSSNAGLLDDTPRLELNDDSYMLAVGRKEVYKVSALTGLTDRVFASQSTGPWGFLSPADVIDDVAIISATDNTLNAVDLKSGSFLWELSLGDGGGELPSVPSCSSSHCLVIGGDNVLRAVEPATASVIWATSLDLNSGSLRATGFRHPLVTRELIYVATDYEGAEYRLNIYSRGNGRLQSSVPFSKQIYAAPTILNDRMLVVAEDQFIALDLTDFSVLWQNMFVGMSIPAIVGRTAVITIQDGLNNYIPTKFGTAAIDIDTGQILWVEPGPALNYTYRPSSDSSMILTLRPEEQLILPGATVVSPEAGVPVAIRASDGAQLWEHEGIGHTDSEPLVVPGFVFVPHFYSIQNRSLGLAAIDSRTGAIKWFENSGFAGDVSRQVRETILVHGGRVYRSEEFPTVLSNL